MTIDDSQRIERLAPEFLSPQEVIAPGMTIKINDRLKIRPVAHTAVRDR
jgi:hypothetical protein